MASAQKMGHRQGEGRRHKENGLRVRISLRLFFLDPT